MEKASATELPWQLVEGNENHGPYITSDWGRDICDLYTMSNPLNRAVCNGGDSKPVWFDDAVANASLIVRAVNAHATLVAALELADETLMADGYDADSHTRTAIASALARCSTTEEQPPCA